MEILEDCYLYLAGIEVPLVSAQIQGAINQPAMATVSIPPDSMLWDEDVQTALARCPASIYFKEHVGYQTGYKKLLFEGEITGMAITRSSGQLSVELRLQDISTYFRTLGIYQFDPLKSLFGAKIKSYDLLKEMWLRVNGSLGFSAVASEVSLGQGIMNKIWNDLSRAKDDADPPNEPPSIAENKRLSYVIRKYLLNGQPDDEEEWGLLRPSSGNVTTETEVKLREWWVSESINRLLLYDRLKVIDSDIATIAQRRLTDRILNMKGGIMLGKVSIMDVLSILAEEFTYDFSIIPSCAKLKKTDTHPAWTSANSIIFKPRLLFGWPPRTNVILPRTAVSFSWSRNFLEEPTRVLDMCSAFGIETMTPQPLEKGDSIPTRYLKHGVNPGYVARETCVNDSGFVVPRPTGANDGVVDTYKARALDPRPHNIYEAIKGKKTIEFHHGPEAYYENEKSVGDDGKEINTPMEDEQTFALWQAQQAVPFLYQNFYKNSQTVLSSFNPYPALGFPTLVIDRAGFHILGYLLSYSHTLRRGQVGSQFTIGFMHPYDRPLRVPDIGHSKEERFIRAGACDKLYESCLGTPTIAMSGKQKGYDLENLSKVVLSVSRAYLQGDIGRAWTRRPTFSLQEHRDYLSRQPERPVRLDRLTTPASWGSKGDHRGSFGLSGGVSTVDRRAVIRAYKRRIAGRRF